jgi:hypothetical protein
MCSSLWFDRAINGGWQRRHGSVHPNKWLEVQDRHMPIITDASILHDLKSLTKPGTCEVVRDLTGVTPQTTICGSLQLGLFFPYQVQKRLGILYIEVKNGKEIDR